MDDNTVCPTNQPAKHPTVCPTTAPAPLLGNNAGIATPLSGENACTQALIRRYALQAAARERVLSYSWPAGGELFRLVKCMRTPYGAAVDVLHVPEHRAAVYRGLTTCGSPWSCPVCAAKIAIRRREELRQGLAEHERQGGRVALVTYTIRHKHGDDLANLLRAMAAARRQLKSGKAAGTLADQFAIVGSVRALEVTHGDNGWHPHYHELVFLSRPVNPARLRATLLARWAGAVVDAGLRDITHRGVDVQLADLSVADYITKYGHERTWGVESEVTLGRVKQGRYGGRTPVQLLADYNDGDAGAGDLWLEYARVLKGQRSLWWSPGLRASLALQEEKTDAEVASDRDAVGVLLASLDRQQWRRVLANDARAELLAVAGSGDPARVAAFLLALGA